MVMCYNLFMKKLIELKNGLKVVIVQNTAVRSVALGVFVGAGSAYEQPSQSGISHFIEHMLFKGTKKRNSFDIANEIDCIGAQINAFTAKCYTCYYTVSLDTNVEKCFDILSDMYFNSTFEQSEFEKERRVVLEEINESEDTPDDLCIEKLSSVFYKNHPLGKPILGTSKSLNEFTPSDLFAYKNKFYNAKNTVLSVAGNISEEEAVRLAEKYFAFENYDNSIYVPSELPAAEFEKQYIVTKKDIEQMHIGLAFPCFAYDSDQSMAAQLLALVFGMEMSSRLFQTVREKLGLCYTIMGYPSAYQNNGSFVIFTSTNQKSVEKALSAIKAEIELLLADGITKEELLKGKEQLKTSLVLGEESTSSMMRAFGRHAIQTNELYDFDKRLKQIDSLNESDILNAAKKIFDFKKLSLSIVGKGCKTAYEKLI